ncbi:hypothetical protein TSOC_001293 [Tetrabaena socialis]|uniref:Uncharacterized protein n=1 Tax=Tetrabaena socialis TaxID=47790 RepID=A0A2J8AH05_9CHLO|nr:hypothetical protein TSOC_001293 [Tetrabaena socialis]|eukprot:PNH11804.1 hypothetical protein TSOC_001293 [Tetrabaena socialis]
MTAAVVELVGELTSRFPPVPLLDAFSIVYVRYWLSKPKRADTASKLKVVKDYYCKPRTRGGGEVVQPLLSAQALDEQLSVFCTTMAATSTALHDELLLAEQEAQRAKQRRASGAGGAADAATAEGAAASTSASRPAEPSTRQCWERITSVAGLQHGLSEFVKLAELVFVMVPGSVEDERRFSALAFIKSKVRNRLTDHLGVCMRMFSQEFFTAHTFPYNEALDAWRPAAEKRGRYMQNK